MPEPTPQPPVEPAARPHAGSGPVARSGLASGQPGLRGLHWIGAGVIVAALLPMTAALDALDHRDYLAGALLLGLTWVIARTGLDLAFGASQGEGL